MDSPPPEMDRPSRLAWLVLAAIPALFFAPILTTGLFMDDVTLAIMYYQKPHSPGSIAAEVWPWITGWLASGRFTPISSILSVALLHFFDFESYPGYHVLQYIALVALALFFVASFIEGTKEKIACMLLVCGMSAIYPNYHDPYVSYHLLMPVFVLIFFGAVLLFEKYLGTGKAGWGVLALTLFLLAVVTYEIAYPLVFVPMVQLLRARPGDKRCWAVLGILFVVLVAFQGWLRTQVQDSAYEGTSLSLDPLMIVRTFVMQAVSIAPLGQQFGGNFVQLSERIESVPLDAIATVVVFILIAVFSLFLAYRFFRERSWANTWAMVGLIIWLGPALLLAISAKYQGELDWGNGYLPRYLQIFGFTMMIYHIAGGLLRSRVVLVILGAVFMASFAYNLRNIAWLNRDFASYRLLFAAASDPGFLKQRGCGKLFVADDVIHAVDRFWLLADGVDITAEGEPAEGDHILMVHHAPPGRGWGVIGTLHGNRLSDLQVLAGEEAAIMEVLKSPSPGGLREWKVYSLPDREIDYAMLREAVSAGTWIHP